MDKRSHGFSLVELMISITIGLVLLAGVARVFVDSKQGYRVQESSGRLQESSRFATEYLNRTVRLADLWGGGTEASLISLSNGTSPVTTGSFMWPGPSGASTCQNGWLINVSEGLRGYVGDSTIPPASTLPAGFDCMTSADYVAGSDILALRFADPDSYLDSTSLVCGSTPGNGPFYLKVLGGQRSVLFNVSDATDCSAAGAVIPGAGINGVLNYQYQFVAFFLRPCSNKGGSAACNGSSDGGKPIPTLSMIDLTATGVQQDTLVEGVEMLKFEYGIDSVNTYPQSVTGYVTADKLATTDWSKVLSVRATMIVRGDALDTYDDTATKYQMTSAYTFVPGTFYAGASNFAALMRYQRRLVVKEINLRNRTRQ